MPHPPSFINLCLILILSTTGLATHAQSTYVVTAPSGLSLRTSPSYHDSAKVATMPYGMEVTVLEQTGQYFAVTYKGRTIFGEWMKVRFTNDPIYVDGQRSEGYAFGGFLRPKEELQQEVYRIMKPFRELKGYLLSDRHQPFYLNGDFTGDGVPDLAIMVHQVDSPVRLAIINYGRKRQEHEVLILTSQNTGLRQMDYMDEIGIFQKVAPGEVLWSNYTDDFRSFKDVPEQEKVVLPYEALYVHVVDACGGGFIFWKDGRFHWLQQE